LSRRAKTHYAYYLARRSDQFDGEVVAAEVSHDGADHLARVQLEGVEVDEELRERRDLDGDEPGPQVSVVSLMCILISS